MELINLLTIAVVIVIALFAIGMILRKLYHRASKQISFVRTGFGGQIVIMDGGAMVLPVMHEIIPVNMNTLRLEVNRANDQALITRDRMRVDVLAEFYVRVKPTEESIANAAQTLGMRTMQPDTLKELVEGKFVDALRAVAAEMAMTELHEKRVDFVQKVQQVVSEDLLKNGLELESVSLTGLDQTSREYFNPDNAFDAEGLTKLTEEIESRRKRRNDIEQDTQVEIKRKNLEAERHKLEIGREEEYARLKQQRELEIRRAAQSAEIAVEQAEKKRDAAQAEIVAKQQTDQARITSERAVEEARIHKERELKEMEIARAKAVQAAEIEKEKAIEAATINKQKVVELDEQDRAIAIAEKSKDKSEAEAQASHARASAVRAAEQVITVQEGEKAERGKQIELVDAAKQAETEALRITVAAEAEKRAASDKADAVRILAEGDADKFRIAAQGNAEGEKLAADAAEKRYAVEAEGKRAIHEAENILSTNQIGMQVKMAIIKYLPDIIRESVKPMENIEGIRIVQVEGLNSGNASSSQRADLVTTNLADQVVNSALRYRAQAPIIEALLKEIGLEGSSIGGLTASLKQEMTPPDRVTVPGTAVRDKRIEQNPTK